jgi:hypothetical protein
MITRMTTEKARITPIQRVGFTQRPRLCKHKATTNGEQIVDVFAIALRRSNMPKFP